MILKTESKGNIIVTSDTVYTKESYDSELQPGGSINKTQKEFFDDLEKIKEMEREHSAMLVYGHDYEQIVTPNKEGSFI